MALELLQRLARELRGRDASASLRWRGVAVLDRGALGEASFAVDHLGHGMALWDNDGGLWSLPIGPGSAPALARLPQGEGRSALMAMNLDGKGVALWTARTGDETHLLGLVLGAKGNPSKEIWRTEGKITHLLVAVDRRGNTLVVWLHELQGTFEILALSFEFRSQSWEHAPIRLGLSSDRALEPRLAVNHREHAMVLWHAQSEAFDGLVARHYLPSERYWSHLAAPVVARRTAMHRVAMDSAGNAQAIWVHQAHGERSGLESAFFDARTSAWSQPETLARAQTFSSPELAVGGKGEALAAWIQAETSGAPKLFAKAFQEGNWESEVERLDPGNGIVREFAIAIGDHGRAGLITLQHGPEGYQAQARWRDGKWSSPTRLGSITQAPLSSPHLALSSLGAVALWTLHEGSSRSLLAAVGELQAGQAKMN